MVGVVLCDQGLQSLKVFESLRKMVHAFQGLAGL